MAAVGELSEKICCDLEAFILKQYGIKSKRGSCMRSLATSLAVKQIRLQLHADIERLAEQYRQVGMQASFVLDCGKALEVAVEKAKIAKSGGKLKSPGICLHEPCHYSIFRLPGETHEAYHKKGHDE